MSLEEKCFHCDTVGGGHTEVCPTHNRTKCPPHRRGALNGDIVCTVCGKLWDDIPQLYAIAYEYRASKRKGASITNVWLPEFQYLHATSVGDARVQFLGSQSPHLHMRIVGIAPVLGFLVDDSHGDELTV